MTLAYKDSRGVLWIGGVHCETCGRDRHINSKTGECSVCHTRSKYTPQGTIVQYRNPETGRWVRQKVA